MNYCPYCGSKLNYEVKYCPYCGKALNNEEIETETEKVEEINCYTCVQKDPSWVNKWEKRFNQNKAALILVCAGGTLFLMGCFIRLMVQSDLEEVFVLYLVFVIFLAAFGLFLTIAILRRKFIVREIEGFTVVLYTSSNQNALIVEDEIVDSQSLHHSRYHTTRTRDLHGKLPNGTKIFANFENDAIQKDVYIESEEN